LVNTDWGYTGVGFTDNQDIPEGHPPTDRKMLIALKQVLANAQVTMQSRDRATGGAASWGNIVERSVSNLLERDFPWACELACVGNGKAVLAEVVSCVYAAGPPKTITFTCDNNYTNSGIENVQLIRKGMYVDIYAAGLAALTDASATGLKVTAVSFGNRKNGAATTGTFTVEVSSDWSAAVADGDIVVLAYSVNKLPQGLLGLVQDGTHFAGDFQLATFQNLARGSYPSLRSLIYEATDFGPESEAPADGTPCSWDLSVVSDAMSGVENGGGGGLVSALFCHGDLARAIYRLGKAEASMSVTVTTTAQQKQPAVGSEYATVFRCPDGRDIPIYRCKTLPANVLYGMTMRDLRWHPLGDFDWLRLYGGIWGPTKGDRKANFEAPYGGYYEISAERCDNSFCIRDMRTDVG
jgi:hypothetical protein